MSDEHADLRAENARLRALLREGFTLWEPWAQSKREDLWLDRAKAEGCKIGQGTGEDSLAR